jgi:hypothetical protein
MVLYETVQRMHAVDKSELLSMLRHGTLCCYLFNFMKFTKI